VPGAHHARCWMLALKNETAFALAWRGHLIDHSLRRLVRF